VGTKLEHIFQKTWIDADVEAEYLNQITAMIHAGDLDVAAEKLLEDLVDITSPIGDMCRDLSEDSVEISGWQEIGDSIAAYEGDPITAVHILMSNEVDLAFEDKNLQHNPILDVAFYSDEIVAFSSLNREELLAESLSEDPKWYGMSEDIEVYLEINGLGPLNTALLRHKRQFYFRDQMHALDEANGLAEDTVPILYIEYRLAAMLRVVRYHQAVKDLLNGYGLYGNIPVIVSMDNMRLEIGSVYMPRIAKVVEQVKTAKLAINIKRTVEEDHAPAEVVGSRLRENLSPEPEKRPGFFRRLFGLK
jgi:hypothetical protein